MRLPAVRLLLAAALVLGLAAIPGTAAADSVAGSTTTSPVTTTAPLAPPKGAITPKPGWLPLPARSGTGRRIVYSMRGPQHVWVVDARGHVVRQFAVSGRTDRPAAGTYRVFSKSVRGVSSTYGVTFRHMIRFAHGRSAAIGFHSIPRYRDGYLVHPASMLGLPIGWGGCPHLTEADARWLYSWAGVGTTVVVVR